MSPGYLRVLFLENYAKIFKRVNLFKWLVEQGTGPFFNFRPKAHSKKNIALNEKISRTRTASFVYVLQVNESFHSFQRHRELFKAVDLASDLFTAP